MLREQIFSDISNYPKPVNPDWQSAVAEYLEEVGDMLQALDFLKDRKAKAGQ